VWKGPKKRSKRVEGEKGLLLIGLGAFLGSRLWEWIMNVNAPADRLSLGTRQGRLGLEPVGAELVISPKFDLRVDAGRGGFAL
jgi:hypothetical protein